MGHYQIREWAVSCTHPPTFINEKRREMKWEEEWLSNPPVAYISNRPTLPKQCHTCRSKSSSSDNADYIHWIAFLASFGTSKKTKDQTKLTNYLLGKERKEKEEE